MRTLCNGYAFARASRVADLELPTLYNPHLVYHYIQQVKTSGFAATPTDNTSIHSSHVLQHIADNGDFSVDDLIKLIGNGSVSTNVVSEFNYSDYLHIGKELEITWSFLQHLGILTYNPNTGGLRVPNRLIELDVLERIARYLKRKREIRSLMSPAFYNLIQGNADNLVQLLKQFLKTRSLKTLISERENGFQSVVEIVLDEPRRRVPEFPLVMDDTRVRGDGRFGFVDLFIPPFEYNGKRTYGVALELKYITLDGLWQAENRGVGRAPTNNSVFSTGTAGGA